MENARKHKTEMEKGMEKWSEKVLNVQVESIRKAEDKVQQGKLEMKQTIGEERKSRESKVCKKQRENKERIEKKIGEKRNQIENKIERVSNKSCSSFPLCRSYHCHEMPTQFPTHSPERHSLSLYDM